MERLNVAVTVAVKVTGPPLSDASVTVAVSVAAVPSVHPPTVATPFASVSCVAPLSVPELLPVTNDTEYPGTGLPSESLTITDGRGDADVPAVPVMLVALFAAMLAAAPGPTVTCNDDEAYCVDVFMPSMVARTVYTPDL